MVHSSGRFKTVHTDCYLSAKAYGEVHRFETALYGALLRGQSKKRYLHDRFAINFKEVRCYEKRNPEGDFWISFFVAEVILFSIIALAPLLRCPEGYGKEIGIIESRPGFDTVVLFSI